METVTRFNPDMKDLAQGNADPNVSELEGFSHHIDELLAKVNELEQGVNVVEQFYMTADNKQHNTDKYNSVVKDKIREKYLTKIENQEQHASQREAAAEKRMRELMRQFAGIFHQITQHSWAWPFLEPVDVVGLGLHDYYEVIEKPMDFGTIKNKMEAKDSTGYKNVREIYADVRLVFKNAMKYNNERDDVHIMAKTLLEKFEEKWLQLLPKVVEEERKQTKEQVSAQAGARLAQEASYANMSRDLSRELSKVDVQLEKLRKTVVQKCRKMTVEEKKKLGMALTRLSPEDLTRALEIVADDNPSFQATAEVVDLDMDAQSELTLWRLKVFVKNALKVMGRNSAGVDGNDSNEKKDNTNINNKRSKNSIPTATAATTTNKRRREMRDAINRTSTKKTRRISLIS